MTNNASSATLDISERTDGVIFSVHVQPRASRTEICGVQEGKLRIRLTSPPVDDAANRLCIDLLANRLHISRSNVMIIAGSKSRRKTIKATGVSGSELQQLLTA